MSKMDWWLFWFGVAGWIVAWITAAFYAKSFQFLSNEVIEILKEQARKHK